MTLIGVHALDHASCTPQLMSCNYYCVGNLVQWLWSKVDVVVLGSQFKVVSLIPICCYDFERVTLNNKTDLDPAYGKNIRAFIDPKGERACNSYCSVYLVKYK